MTSDLHTAAPSAESVRHIESIGALDVFKEVASAATVLHREIPQHVTDWLEALPEENLPKGRVILPTQALPDAVLHLCDMVGMPTGAERSWFQEDVIRLAETFAELMEAPFLRMRLDVVNTNACRKFHVDNIVARLICTYRGTGTQYGVVVDNALPDPIETVKRGSPILLRGHLWPEEPRSGLHHRSPPIEGTGETRLVLVLDPIFDPQGEV